MDKKTGKSNPHILPVQMRAAAQSGADTITAMDLMGARLNTKIREFALANRLYLSQRAANVAAGVSNDALEHNFFMRKKEYEEWVYSSTGPESNLVPDLKSVVSTQKKTKNSNRGMYRASEEDKVVSRGLLTNKLGLAGWSDRATKKQSEHLDDLARYISGREADDALADSLTPSDSVSWARGRKSKWMVLSPRNIDPEFLKNEFGYSDFHVSQLMSSGMESGGSIHQLFSMDMSMYEMTGSVMSKNSLMPGSGKLSRKGQFSREAGAEWLGIDDSGSSLYIPVENQPGFARHVLGRSNAYSFTDTGELLSRDKVTQIRRIRPAREEGEMRSLGAVDKLKQSAMSRRDRLKLLAKMEKVGILRYTHPVDLTGNQRKSSGMIESEDWQDFLSSTYQEGEVKTVDPVDLLVASEGDGRMLDRLSSEEKIALSEAAGEISGGNATIDYEALSDRGKKAELRSTGIDYKAMSPSAVARIEKLTGVGGLSSGIHLGRAEGSAIEEVHSYKQVSNYFKRQYEEFRDLYDRAFLNDWTLTDGGVRKTPLAEGQEYSKELISNWKKMSGDAFGQTANVGELGYSGIEGFFGSAPEGWRLQARSKRGKWRDIASKPIGSYSDIMMENVGGRGSTLLSQIGGPVPYRAAADQVFDAYFKRVEGSTAFSAHTSAGTYLGMLESEVAPAHKMYAKIFQHEGQFRVGVDAIGAIEGASSFKDLGSGMGLSLGQSRQSELERMYWQKGGDYSLISKYRYDPSSMRYRNVETGKFVADTTIKRHKRMIDTSYRVGMDRVSMATRLEAPVADIGDTVFGRANKWFESRSKRTKGMLLSGVALSAALLLLRASSSRQHVTSEDDVAGSDHAMSTEDQRIFQGRNVKPPPARITPQYSSRRGYTTNIDIQSSGAKGLDHDNLSRVMDRHARMTLGTTDGRVSVDISDDTDRGTQDSMKRKFANMMRT
jgi:hypothetical protein